MKKDNNNTWSMEASRVNISLDALSPANKYHKQQQPTMNQLQQQGMNNQMVGLTQGMAGMGVNQPQGQVMAGQQRQMMGQGMGMAVNMQGGMGMMGSMNMQTAMMGQSSFQQRTDQAFSTFGNIKK